MLQKVSLMEEFLDSKSFIEFGKRLIIFDRWFEKTFMQLRLLFGFWHGRNVPLFKLKATSRKDPSIGFVLISILKPKFLNIWMTLFLSLSISLPFQFFTTVKPSSLYNPTSFWMMSFVGCDNINIPRSSNTLAQSRHCGIAKTFYCVSLFVCHHYWCWYSSLQMQWHYRKFLY